MIDGRRVPWAAGMWTTAPEATTTDGEDLLVTCREGSDAWRHTSYGFVHDTEHGLVAPVVAPLAVEVSFVADLPEQFDQAGVLLRTGPATWVKAGLERADGVLQLGAVVTHGSSDWSAGRVEDWAGRLVTVRASLTDGADGADGADCADGAVVIRARVDDEPFRLVRVAPFPADGVSAGPYCCAPTRPGLVVRFTGWRETAADASLH